MFIARISEPAGTLLVVDDDLVVRGLKTVVLGQQGLRMRPSHHACKFKGRTCPISDTGLAGIVESGATRHALNAV